MAFFDAGFSATVAAVTKHPIAQSPARGLYSTSLMFGENSVAGGAAAVTVKFASSVAMAIDDQVLVKLTDFGGADEQLEASHLDGPSEPSYQRGIGGASAWDLSARRLTLKLGEAVDAGAAQEVTMLSTAGVTIPVAGVAANQATLQVAFVDGNTADNGFPDMARVRQSPQLAALALQDTSLAYAATAADGNAVAITAKFENPIAMAVDDHIQLTLTSFTGLTVTTATASMATWIPATDPSTFKHSASSWASTTDKLLKLAVNADVPAGQPQTCTVDLAFGITLPAASLDTDDARLQIQFTDAAPAHTTSAVAVAQSPALGLHDASLALGTATLGGGDTAIVIAFKNTLPMAPMDAVSLELPHLEGPDKAVGEITDAMLTEQPSDAPRCFEPAASSWTDSTKTLRLLVAAAVPAHAATAVTLGPAAQIVIAAEVTQNQPSLRIKYSAIDYAASAVAASPGVALTVGASLAYSTTFPEAPEGDIVLNVRNWVATSMGDVYNVKLADFRGADIDASPGPAMAASQLEAGAGYAAADCTWAEVDKILALKANSDMNGDIAPSTVQSFTIHPQSGIKLPTRSLAVNDSGLTIAFVDATGGSSILAHPIAQSPARGGPECSTRPLRPQTRS